MADVVAITRGYFGGVLIEAGETFSLPDELWADEKRRPKWAKPADGSEQPAAAEAEEPAPKKPGRPKKAAPFEDAPEPVRAQTEIAEQTGGIEPDWVKPV